MDKKKWTPKRKKMYSLLGSVLGRTDFCGFLFSGRRIFSWSLSSDFSLLIFVRESAKKNPPGKSPAKSSKIYTTKIPDALLQRGQANLWWFSLHLFHLPPKQAREVLFLLEQQKKARQQQNTVGTKVIGDPEKCFQELISENSLKTQSIKKN